MRLLVLPLLLLAACKPPPPDAPQELDELVGYLFSNFAEDDPAPLEAGAYNLDAWLDENIDQTLEGYAVNDLTAEAVQALEGEDWSVDGIAGAAVGHVSAFGPDPLAEALVTDDLSEIYEGTYLDFEREFTGNNNCFADVECDWLEAEVHADSSYAGILDVQTHSRVQYRWVETDLGPVYVERSWLREPATVNVDFLEVDQQYYVRMMLPDADGSRSIQATWVLARLTGDSVPEDVALNLVIDSMEKQAASLDAWVEAK